MKEERIIPAYLAGILGDYFADSITRDQRNLLDEWICSDLTNLNLFTDLIHIGVQYPFNNEERRVQIELAIEKINSACYTGSAV